MIHICKYKTKEKLHFNYNQNFNFIEEIKSQSIVSVDLENNENVNFSLIKDDKVLISFIKDERIYYEEEIIFGESLIRFNECNGCFEK